MARGTSARLSAFYAAYFGTVGVWLPFWPVWLASKELDPAQIGLVLAVGFWVRILTNPLVGWLSDARGERRRPMVVLGALATLGYLGFAAASVPWHFIVLSAVTGATYTVLVPFADSVTLARVRSDAIDYGRVRLWGSLAFIATSVAAGRLLSDRSSDLVLWLVVSGVGLTFLSCVAMPSAPPAEGRPVASFGDLGRLLRQSRYVLLVLSCALVQSSHAVYYGFATLHWQAAGHSGTVAGLLWAEGVVAEILLFFAGARVLARLEPATLIAVGGLAGVVRWLVLAETTLLPALVAVQLLHGLTFAATHLGAMTALGRTVPESLSATALTVYSTAVGGAALGLGMSIAGSLYASHRGAAFFFAAALGAAGAIAALLLRHPRHKCQTA
jgi:PPP family 3-phenylpropionic acid transporter